MKWHKGLTIVVVAFTLMYLAFAFVSMEYNLINWDSFGRFLYLTFSIACSLVIIEEVSEE